MEKSRQNSSYSEDWRKSQDLAWPRQCVSHLTSDPSRFAFITPHPPTPPGFIHWKPPLSWNSTQTHPNSLSPTFVSDPNSQRQKAFHINNCKMKFIIIIRVIKAHIHISIYISEKWKRGKEWGSSMGGSG